jgi:hypothetical protein
MTLCFVIPGRALRANPESRADNLWIPGLRQEAHPGMTNSGLYVRKKENGF